MTDSTGTFIDELVAMGALQPAQATRLLSRGAGMDIEAMVRGAGVQDGAWLQAASIAWALPLAPSTVLDIKAVDGQREALEQLGVPLQRDLWLRLQAAPCIVNGQLVLAWARAASTGLPVPVACPYRSVLALPERVHRFRDAVCLLPPPFAVPSTSSTTPATPRVFDLPRPASRSVHDPLVSGGWMTVDPALVASGWSEPAAPAAPLAFDHETDFSDVTGAPSVLRVESAGLAPLDLPSPPPLAEVIHPAPSNPWAPAPTMPVVAAPASPASTSSPKLPVVAAPVSPAPPASPTSTSSPKLPVVAAPPTSTSSPKLPVVAAAPPPTVSSSSSLPSSKVPVLLALPASLTAPTEKVSTLKRPVAPAPGSSTSGRLIVRGVLVPASTEAERTTVVSTGRFTLATAAPPVGQAMASSPALPALPAPLPKPTTSSSTSTPPGDPVLVALVGAPGVVSAEEAVRRSMASESAPASGPSIGAWSIERSLGSGASADVYLASRGGQRAALKLLRLEPFTADEQRVRFEREGNLVARLTHQNVVRLYERGLTDGTPWMACEYIDGGSVAELMALTGPMPAVLATRIICDTLRGLASAHREGIIHRDMKPGNLLLTRTGTCKVADFGIAKADDNLTLTQEGVAYGTPAYMSPEQASGQKLDHRSDLFGVGTIFWQLLTGTNPFMGRTIPGTLVAVARAEPGDLLEHAPGVPVGVARVVETLMARAPGNRFATADQAIEALQPLLDWMEVHEPNVITRALAAPIDTVVRLRAGQAGLEEKRVRAALARRPPMRQEAALSRHRALQLHDDADVAAAQKEFCAQHRYHLEVPRLDELPDLVRTVTRTEQSPALLRRAGLAHFDAGNLVEARFYLRRFLAWGGSPDDAVTSRLRNLLGPGEFAPFELTRTQRGDDVVATAAPQPTERLDRKDPLTGPEYTSNTMPTMSGLDPVPLRSQAVSVASSPPSRRAATLQTPIVAAIAVAVGLSAGVLLSRRDQGQPSPPPPVVSSSGSATNVDVVDDVAAARLYRDARGAARRDDVGGALVILARIMHEAPTSSVAVSAALLAGELHARHGNPIQARRAYEQALAHARASAGEQQAARAGLAGLPR